MGGSNGAANPWGCKPHAQTLQALGAHATDVPANILVPVLICRHTGNRLPSIPNSLTQLVHLQDLNLSGNRLASLPDNIGAWTELKKLSVHGNQLQQLPEQGWEQLQKLDEVCVQGNQLTTLPEGIAKLGVSSLLFCIGGRCGGKDPTQQHGPCTEPVTAWHSTAMQQTCSGLDGTLMQVSGAPQRVEVLGCRDVGFNQETSSKEHYNPCSDCCNVPCRR